MGMGTYRFSNKHLAKAITVQGRLTLKIAQMIVDLYLNDLIKNQNRYSIIAMLLKKYTNFIKILFFQLKVVEL